MKKYKAEKIRISQHLLGMGVGGRRNLGSTIGISIGDGIGIILMSNGDGSKGLQLSKQGQQGQWLRLLAILESK